MLNIVNNQGLGPQIRTQHAEIAHREDYFWGHLAGLQGPESFNPVKFQRISKQDQ